MKNGFTSRAAAVALCCALSACADISGEPAVITPSARTAMPPITIAADVDIKLSTGYKRTLRQNSVWLPVGRIASGEVYKPLNNVFSVEGINVHEAYLVLSGGLLVGYYLPAEQSYVIQPHSIAIPTK